MEMGIRKTLSMDYQQALERLPEALRSEGFGVLTEIDMRETMKKKLGVEFRRYILGACNPPLAHQALSANLGVGLMLPLCGRGHRFHQHHGRGRSVAGTPRRDHAGQAGGSVGTHLEESDRCAGAS